MQMVVSDRVVGQQPNGERATVPVIQFSNGTGPKVYIQANIHGAEIQGNAVIERFLSLCRTHPPQGQFTIVPMANPIGINQKSGEFTLGRFDPISGDNWNRQYHFNGDAIAPFAQQQRHASDQQVKAAFTELLQQQLQARLQTPWGLKTGQRMALSLQQLATDADIVLDLHTGPVSDRHLYVPEFARAQAKRFNIPLNIIMPADFGGALDEAAFSPWWQLSQAFAALGRDFPIAVNAFTLELGSQEHLDPHQAEQDALGIASYLEQHGCWADGSHHPTPVTQHACLLQDYRALYSPSGGQVEYLGQLGTPLPQGQAIARIWHYHKLGQDTPLFEEITLPCDAIPVLHFASANAQQGTELYKVLTNTFEL
ncbi:succinylglutamate desuccinylase/aspartoacylase family protein [uncultured Ferrimonas sp.]|uniref:succinylglutamate desuccinylase/aspartoacylase domain-containing protein n=1 Tax=uncultured Ferrimonas sp. TaxID=432640 RepID=UPI0026368784|nr:succinylglutamate desuccinylase/aspartoacylase family protein [uncultured Ferrimonas sp.]